MADLAGPEEAHDPKRINKMKYSAAAGLVSVIVLCMISFQFSPDKI
jgi:hypothetical protein